MNPNALDDLFREWRVLTEGERQAIGAEDWPQVHELQRQKNELKLRISGSIESWQSGRASQGDYQRRVNHLVAELVSLETSNAELVTLHREKVRAELAGFDRSSGNLRGLNRAYGSRPRACWTSYS